MVNPRRWGLSVSYMWSRSDSTEPEPDLRSRIPLEQNQRVSACALDNPRANWTPSHLERMRVPGSTARHFASARVTRDLYRKCSGGKNRNKRRTLVRSTFDKAVCSEPLTFAADAGLWVLNGRHA